MKTYSRIVRVASALLLAACALPAWADIPAAERAVLVALYNQTHGDSWTHTAGWKAAPLAADGLQDTVCGTPATWWGITCDGTNSHIVEINLSNNNLAGNMPSLTDLPALQRFVVNTNQLTGGIPALPASIIEFNATANQLTGAIPALAGLTHLETFGVGGNRLTGGIPALSGLPALTMFYVDQNQLTGPIPALPATLEKFLVFNNQLTGAPPAAPASLVAGISQLCPNYLQPSATASINADWDAATGESPWSKNCPATPIATSAAARIPTLETAGLALLALLLAGGAAARMRRS